MKLLPRFLVILLLPFCAVDALSQTFTIASDQIGRGVYYPTAPTGVGVADYNGDGWVDLLVNDNIAQKPNLLKNSQNGGYFELVSDAADLTLSTYSLAWGDFNNDGFPDLVTSRYGTTTNGFHIFRNDPGEEPAQRKFTAIHVLPTQQGGHPCWVDYDLDGDLDLYIAYSINTPHQLLRNELKETGSVSFKDVTAETELLGIIGNVNSIHWADVDNDGDPDFYIPIDKGTDLFFRNELKETGYATFTDILADSKITTTYYGAVVFGDYDNDGDLDVYQSTGNFRPNRMFRNELVETGELCFEEVTSKFGVGDASGNGVTWADYDNDGDLDLLSSTSNSAPWSMYRNDLEENNGTPGFTRVTGTVIEGLSEVRSALFIDMENDGDLDIYVQGFVTGKKLYENHTRASGEGYSQANWLGIKLVGTQSTREGNGARVIIENNGIKQIRDAQRHIRSSGTQQPGLIRFGLKDATSVDKVTVLWPSGMRTEHVDVPVNGVFSIHEIINTPPVADAGKDQSVIVGATVQLNGEGSYDDDGDGLTYQWSILTKPAGSTADLSNSEIVDPTFLADLVGSYKIRLIVNDSTDDSASNVVVMIAQTQEEAIDDIIEEIVDIVSDGDLNKGQGNALTKKLKNALKKLDKPKTAINQLKAFINQVNSLVADGELPSEDGEALIAAVNAVIKSLGGAPVTKVSIVPQGFSLSNASPNPFNPQTTIHYTIPYQALVTLIIYNIQGQVIDQLVNKTQNPGSYIFRWDASKYSSGVYFYQLRSESFVSTKKMILLK